MIRLLSLAVAALFSSSLVWASSPKLILQITVDGLRADLLKRYGNNLTPGGFRHLLDEGAVFTNAHYLHANTETIVGHTTLATGATPAVHGMVGNVWYQAESGKLGYNIEDPEAPLLPTDPGQVTGAQVDPAQLRAGSSGRSPRSILVPTLADSLKISQPGAGKVFSISGKDRSAVAMAGKVGTAYWYSTDTGHFQTSRYYMDAYPDWVQDWNIANHAAALANTSWQLSLEAEKYLLGDQDDRDYEVDLKGYGKTFPHDYGPAEDPLFYTKLMVSPAGDNLLAEFAKQLILAEELGQDDNTDYLSVSFSSVDAVNHFFGPSSLENEDTVLSLDRSLASFLEFVDQEIGLGQTLIVLSADHGMAEMPELASEKGYQAGRIYSDQLLEYAQEQAKRLFGSEAIIRDFFRPYIYLDERVVADRELEKVLVIEQLAAAISSVPGIAVAVPAADAQMLGEAAVAHNHHPSRSGDIYVYQEPHWFLFDRGAVGVMHGSPWAYDTHVPLIFAGPGVARGTYDDRVNLIDAAPTLAALLGITPPAAAQGRALKQVFTDRP